MIVKCPSCEVEFSADASEGPITTCPVCAADVPLAEGSSIDVQAEPSVSRRDPRRAPAGPEGPGETPSPRRGEPRGVPEAPPAGRSADPFEVDDGIGFDSPKAAEITYSKRKQELKYSEEVIWPSRPAQRRTALDGLGAKPAESSRPSPDRAAAPRAESRPSAPPPDERPTPRRPVSEVLEPAASRAPRDDSARSAASRRPTRVMPETEAPSRGVDERPTMQRMPRVDLLDSGPDLPDLGGGGASLDVDFPAGGAFEEPAPPRAPTPPVSPRSAPTQAVGFEALDLSSLDGEAGGAFGEAGGAFADLGGAFGDVGGASGDAGSPFSPDAGSAFSMPETGPVEDAIPDLGLDSAFSLDAASPDAPAAEKGIFDLDDLVDLPPTPGSRPTEPAAPKAAKPGGDLGDSLFDGAEHTETFFVEASFGGVSENSLVGAAGQQELRGGGAPQAGGFDFDGGVPGGGDENLSLEVQGRDGGASGADEDAGFLGAEALGAAPARRALARSMVKKGGSYKLKIGLLIAVLLIGVGLITGQTSVGFFGVGLFTGGGAPQKAAAPAAGASSAVVAQDDTVVAYQQQVQDLEARIRTAQDAEAKGRLQGDLARLLLKFRDRFPKQFSQDQGLMSRLDALKKEIALTGDGDDMKVMEGLASDDPEVAKKQLDRLVKTQSADAEHLVMYGKVELKAGNYEDAIFYFKEAVKKAPDSMETLYFLGVALRESGSLEGARKIFEEILRKNPDHLSSMLELGRIAIGTGALGKAVEYCDAADKKAKEIKDLSTQFDAHRLLAAVQLKREDFLAYKKELETTIQINPNDEGSLLDLARVEDKLGHLDVAIEYVDKFHDRNKQFSIDFYAGFIDLLMKAENADKAKAIAKEAVERYPADAGLQIAYARALQLKKEGFAAREVYERVLKDHPDIADAYLQMGRLLRADRDYETAIQVLRNGIEKVEKKGPLYKELVDTYLEVRDTNSATEALGEILKIDQKDNETRLRLAHLLKSRGYLDDAYAQYEILYKNGYIPDEMILAYSEVLRDRGKFDDALRELELLRQKTPDSVDVLVRIGSVQIEQGKLDEAEENLSKCATDKPNFELTYYFLGRLYERKGRVKDALDNYRRALQLDPAHDDARFRFAKLLGATGKGKDVEEAVKHLTYIATRYQQQRTKAAEINPAVFLERGELYFKMKIFGKALTDFEQAISLDPTSVETLVRYGQVLITQEQLDEAKVYLTEAISKNDKNFEAYFHLGRIFALRKENRAAQKYLELSLKGDTSKYSEVHRMLGLMYRDLGLTPLARRELKKYLGFNPKSFDHKEIEELLEKL